MRPFPRVLQQAPVPQLVLLFFCTLYFPFQILSEGREHRGWTGTTSVDLCCDALLHNKICCNLHMGVHPPELRLLLQVRGNRVYSKKFTPFILCV